MARTSSGPTTDTHTGLSRAQALRRLADGGRNELRGAPPVSAWRRFFVQFCDPLVYLLLGAIAVSLGAWALNGRHGWPVDALVIAVVVLVNAVLGFGQQAKARQAVQALARMTAVTADVVRDSMRLRVPSAEVVVGDLLVLDEGDAVAADARLVRASQLRLQESSLTGESAAVDKHAGAADDKSNRVFKGTSVVQGRGRAVVTATGMDTEMGHIARLLDATPEVPTPLQVEVQRVGRTLSVAVLGIAVLVIGTLLLLAHDRSLPAVMEVLLLGVSLAVAAVPEGLPAILSVVLSLGVQRMAGHRAIVKDLSSVETLGCASVICSDKTGTLTRAEMTIERIVTASGTVRISGQGYMPTGAATHDGAALAPGALLQEVSCLATGGSLAGNATLTETSPGVWVVHGDPSDAAFLVVERKLGLTAAREARYGRVAGVAFTAARKLMSTVTLDHAGDDAPVLFTKGAPDMLLPRCVAVRVGDEELALDAAMREKILSEVETLTDAALRTLAVAYRRLPVGSATDGGEALEQQLVFVGTAGIFDPPREEAGLAIAQARRAGIRVVMITGDHPRTALRVASDLGICPVDGTALSGVQLDALDDAALAAAVKTTQVFARVMPAHKLRIVLALQAGGEVVAMTGDGVNDAPALKAADIGVAMGVTGTQVTREAARMILADDNFATIVDAVREGRAIFGSIRKFLRYLLSSNMGEVLTVFLGVVAAGVFGLTDASGAHILPLLATQVLWINLITDSGPALAMGIDPPVDDVMARPPRRRSERLIDRAMWSGVLQTGAVMALATLLTLDLYLPGGLIAPAEGETGVTLARTAAFTVLVIAQLFNCFNARSDLRSAFRRPFTNAWLWAAVGLSVGLQVAVVHLPWLNAAFGTLPMTLGQWAVCVGMGSAVLWYREAEKILRRLFSAQADTELDQQGKGLPHGHAPP